MTPDATSAYTLIVSSIPALYRAWKASPNEVALNLNRRLLDYAIEWCQSYQQDVQGRSPDSYEEYRR